MKKCFLPMVLLVLFMLLMPTALAAGNVKINDFSSNITNGTVILYTRFNGSVTGNITEWKFVYTNVVSGNTTYSGGAGSENITVHHNIKKPGVYNVTLMAWGPEGNDTLTKVAYVTANKGSSNIPVADFTASSTYGNAPFNVSFTDNSTGATSWYWKFGDGNISKERNPTHNYSTEGKYTVILAVNNANSWSAKTQEITVQNGLPAVDFSADNSSGSVQFTDLSQNATEWNWDFGDGVASTDESPVHTYSSAGNYTVTLTASNEAGSVSKVSTVNLTEENIANEDSGSSSGGSSHHHSSSSSGSVSASSELQGNVIKVANETDNESTAINVSDNVSASPELQSNVTEAVNETRSESNTQDFEQNNSSTAANAGQMPEQTQSSNTSENGSKSTPGFEMIYGIAGLFGVALYKRR